MSNSQTRPTKKQFETLEFIRQSIADNGFSPSYREIMKGCNYTSVATVSLHVNNLIKRGHLIKRDNNARSLELVSDAAKQAKSETKNTPKTPDHNHGHEIIVQIEKRFKQLEKQFEQAVLDEVYVLVGALKIMGHAEPVVVYSAKINTFKQ